MIALYQGTSLLSRTIRVFSMAGGKYSHASWLCDDGSEYEAWAGHGVVKADHFGKNHTPGTIVDVFDPHLNKQERIEIELFFESQLGKKYDYAGVLNFLPIVRLLRGLVKNGAWEYPNKWFCSELVSAGMRKVGHPLFSRMEDWQISPSLGAASPRLTFYETLVTRG